MGMRCDLCVSVREMLRVVFDTHRKVFERWDYRICEADLNELCVNDQNVFRF